MNIESFEHPFFDIDIELDESLDDTRLVKILSIDGRRFTYEFHGALDEAAVAYIKSVLDAACFSDMRIEHDGSDFQITESRRRLKKHS